MSISTLPFNTAWITDYFAMVDRLDLDEFLRWYSADATLSFGNQPPAHGKPAIRHALEQFYSHISAMHHEKLGCWADADSGAFEAHAHFTTKTGTQVGLPAITTLRVRGGLIHEIRVVMDAAPLLRTEIAPADSPGAGR